MLIMAEMIKVEQQTKTVVVNEAIMYRPKVGKKFFKFYLNDSVTIYKENEDGYDNVATETNVITMSLGQVLHTMSEGNAKTLTWLFTLAGSYFDDAVVAAMTGAKMNINIEPYLKDEEYTDTDGNVDTYENNGQHISISFISLDPIIAQSTAVYLAESSKK